MSNKLAHYERDGQMSIFELDELKELDCEQCPECGTRLDWTPWHRANDE